MEPQIHVTRHRIVSFDVLTRNRRIHTDDRRTKTTDEDAERLMYPHIRELPQPGFELRIARFCLSPNTFYPPASKRQVWRGSKF